MMNALKNKKIIISLAAVVVLVAGSVFFLTGKKDKNEQVTQDKIKKVEMKEMQLPNQAILSDDEPLMNDYIDGFIGNRTDAIKIPQSGSQVYAFSKDMDYVYVSYYSFKDRVGILPNLGSAPTQTTFSPDVFLSLSKGYKEKYPEDYHEENGYIFIQVDQINEEQNAFMISKGVDWINEEPQLNLVAGAFYDKYLASGLGYPSSILRREPYIEGLESIGVDINNKWWDDYNYGATSYYENEDEEVYRVSFTKDNVISVIPPNIDIPIEFMKKPQPEGQSMTPQDELNRYIERLKLKKVSNDRAIELIRSSDYQ